MLDCEKTKDQLINELVELRQENEKLRTDFQYFIKAIGESSQHLSELDSDINNLKKAKQRLKLNEMRLEALVKLNEMTNATIKEIVDYTFKQAIKLTGSEIGWIGFLNDEETIVTIYSYSQNVMEHSKIEGETIDLSINNSGLWGEAIRRRYPVIVNDYSAPNPSKRGYPKGHMPINRLLVIPIFDEKRIVITVAVANKNEDYDESDINQLTLLVSGIRRIIQRKETEEKLCQLEKHFANIFKLSPVAMSISSVSDGKIINVNNAWQNLTGYRKDEVIGINWRKLEIFDIKEIDQCYQITNKKGSFPNWELEYTTKTGRKRYGLFSYEEIILDGQKCRLAVILDITKQRKYEKEIARLDRLYLIGEMAAGIGHEVRNPMTTVRGFLQLLSSKESFSMYSGYFDLMIEELDRANSIITNFLSLAKNKSVNLVKQNLNSIIKNIIPLIEADAMVSDNYIKLELKEIPDLPMDEKEIRQMMLNLVRNGIEAMGSGGTITISTYLDGKDVVLSVADEGKGMSPDSLKKIGTPFFTTKDDGTGLGLPVCYSIASRQNAKIEIETGSTGTTFSVRFIK